MKIHGITRPEFERRVKLALEAATGNPNAKLSRIRQATVLICHGGTGQGQNEHTLDQFFSEEPASQTQEALSPATAELIIRLLVSLDSAVASDVAVCEDSLKHCELSSEEHRLALLALAFAVYRDQQDVPEDFRLDGTPLASHLGTSVCKRLDQLLPPVHNYVSLHDSPWLVLLKAASKAPALQQSIAISYCYETLVREGSGGNPTLRLSDIDVFDTLKEVPEHWRQHCKNLALECIDDALSAYNATRDQADEYGL